MHAHCHHSHDHHSAAGLNRRRLTLAVALTAVFVLVEAGVGLRAHSLALVSDAGHNFTDALALALSWYALRASERPATATRTYGYHRVGILIALFNALTLSAIGLTILREAYLLFRSPQPVLSGLMIGMASGAVLLNTVIALWLRQDAAQSVNIRSAFLHMVGDALSAGAVIGAGLIIRLTGWYGADAVVSALIALFLIFSSWGVVRDALNILLEGAPQGLDANLLARSIEEVAGVLDVHDLHIWTIGDGVRALSCHLLVAESDLANAARVVQSVKAMLASRYAVFHSTIETECGGCQTNALYCQLEARAPIFDHEPG